MKWHTPESAAKHIHMSEGFVYAAVRSGTLESHKKPTRGVLIPESALDALVMSWPSGMTSTVPSSLSGDSA